MKRELIKMQTPGPHDIIANEEEITINLLVNEYETETVGAVSRCLCGTLSSNFLDGEVCNLCNTVVTKERKVFIRAPELPFINLELIYLLTQQMKDFLSLFKVGEKVKSPPLVRWISLNPDFTQTYDYFYRNFDKLMVFLDNYKKYQTLIKVYKETKKEALTNDYVQVIGKGLFTLLKIHKDKSGDLSPIRSMIEVATSREYYNIYRNLCSIKAYYNRNTLQSRKGIVRDEMLGTSPAFNMRAVGGGTRLRVEEILMPWLGAVVMYRGLIIGEGLKRGYKYSDLRTILDEAEFSSENRLINDVFDTIEESRRVVIGIRYPSLTKSSELKQVIKGIKRDPEDHLVGISNLATEPFRGDFDGDNYIYQDAIDQFNADSVEGLNPQDTVIDTFEPYITRTVTPSSVCVLLKRDQVDRNLPTINKIF